MKRHAILAQTPDLIRNVKIVRVMRESQQFELQWDKAQHIRTGNYLALYNGNTEIARGVRVVSITASGNAVVRYLGVLMQQGSEPMIAKDSVVNVQFLKNKCFRKWNVMAHEYCTRNHLEINDKYLTTEKKSLHKTLIMSNQLKTTLSEEQLHFTNVFFCENRRPLSILRGAPGTGKTNLLAIMAKLHYVLQRSKGSRCKILISAKSHKTADQIVELLMKWKLAENHEYVILRVQPKTRQRSEVSEAVLQCCVKQGVLERDCSHFNFRMPLPSEIERADIVVCTLSTAGVMLDRVFSNRSLPGFDFVFVDEACCCSMPELRCAMAYAKDARVVLAGRFSESNTHRDAKDILSLMGNVVPNGVTTLRHSMSSFDQQLYVWDHPEDDMPLDLHRPNIIHAEYQNANIDMDAHKRDQRDHKLQAEGGVVVAREKCAESKKTIFNLMRA